MVRYKKILSFFVTCVLLCAARGIGWAQQITASDSTGCAPFVGVLFTGLPGASGINWDFGDASSSSLANPTHTFSSPGNYTVLYTATVSGNPVSQSIPIKVHGKPTPNFTAITPVKGCTPLPVQFSDQSTGGGGSTIVGWSWAFGDGGVNTSNNPTPTHTYNLAGQFNVSLIVTDANGCDSSFVITQYVTTSKKPNIVVTPAGNVAACSPPLSVTFNGSGSTSNSTTGPALTYFWDFGNGSTSTVASPPPATYTAVGTYIVKFIVTDNNTCSDSITKNVIINNPLASFSVNDTVCKTVVFTNNSSGNNPFWNYGDGSTGSSTTHTYTTPGTYSVTLQVSSGSCKDDTSKLITVEDVKALFTSSPTYVCDLPSTINYIDQSTNAVAWQWTFVPSVPYLATTPDTSYLQNPPIIISNMDTNQYSIYQQEYMGVQLMVTSPHGCKDSLFIPRLDTINLPTARFMPDKTQGCVPLTVQFSDSSISKETIVNWQYIFGDGSMVSGSNPNPTHTYTAAGTYYAMLIIQNSKGCIDTSFSIRIDVGNLPTPNFSASPLSICPGDAVQFTDLTPASDSIDTWHYSTDASFIMSGCPGTPNPSWNFVAATGPQTVTLTVGSKGCYASVTKSNYITVKGPIVQFKTATDCDSSRVYVFTGTFQDADSWTWNLGDGTILTNSTAQQIIHTYSVSGDYLVTLTGVNNTSGCPPSVDTATAFVRQIKAAFLNIDTLFCTSASVSFSGAASVDVNPECNSGYYWLWGDGSGPGIYSSPTAQHTFLSPGFKDVTLIVKDANGCRDTVTQKVKASAVTASYTTNVTYGCLPLTVNFSDQSTSDTTITNWSWTFGDGGSSTLQNPSHTYTSTTVNSFTATATVTNILGCSNVFKKVIVISKPDSTFTASKTTLCAGDSVKFTPSFLNHQAYVWDFGDNTPTSTVVSPYHVFTKGGNYAIILDVTDSIGCKGKKKMVNYIHVQDYPLVGFSSTADTSPTCYPLLAQFTDTSIANIFFTRNWNLGNGSIVVPNPTVGTVYQTPGTYSVSLTVTTTYGCSSTITKLLEVTGPVADFDLAPAVICKGSDVQFSIKDTMNIFTYHWDFGDGYDTTAVSPITHTFNHHPPNGQAVVTLVMWSKDSSCAKTVTHNVTIHQVTAAFDRNNEIAQIDTAHCLHILDVFKNNSQNANTWAWDFGDGTTSVMQNPTHMYMAAGTYTVELNIKNSQLGCVDTLYKEMIIFPDPVVTVVDGDTCLGSSVQLQATGGVSYSWSPSAGLNSTTVSNPIATPAFTTDYIVTVTSGDGCAVSDTAHVYIQQPPPQVTWDTTIVIGQSLYLSAADAGGSFTYVWSPNDSLSCPTCPVPWLFPLSNHHYTVTISDTMGCFTVDSYLDVYIKYVSSLDVPSAFTPNGDGTNDIIYVNGWGIKRLIEFKIYNRWGELLFVSTDLKDGWDGTFKGVPQNIETYVYTAAAETYIDEVPLTKKGYIKIIR